MKKIIPLCFLAFSTLLLSCESENARIDRMQRDSTRVADSMNKIAPPTLIPFARLNDSSLDNKRVTVEGYVALGDFTFENGKESASFLLFERKDEFSTKAPHVYVSVTAGEKNNMMKALPRYYKTSDLVITGNSGEKIYYGEKVKITGMLRVSQNAGYLDAQLIEKGTETAYDYDHSGAIEITPQNISDTSLNGKMVFVDGILEIPTTTSGKTYTDFFLDVEGIDKHLTVNIQYGNAPNHVESLPPSYSEDDFKIHAADNSLVNMKKKVRIYGLWDSPKNNTEGFFWLYAEHIEAL